jgi:hypothetical protein
LTPTKAVPVIVTVSLGIALVGENPVIVGGTVKMELVADPLGVVTVIDPVEAPSGTDVETCESSMTVKPASTAPPLNRIEVAPDSPEPPITNEVVTMPRLTERDEITGGTESATAGREGGTKTNSAPVVIARSSITNIFLARLSTTFTWGLGLYRVGGQRTSFLRRSSFYA